MVESYFRNGHLIDGEWQYSIEACFEEFRLQFPDAALTYNTFHHNLKQCIQIFRETESVDRKKGSGRPTKRTGSNCECETSYGRSPTNFCSHEFNCQPALVTTFYPIILYVWNTAIDFLTHAREFAVLEFLLRRILVPLGRLCQLTKHAMVEFRKT
jgi:hypothetical protein